ncbi:MAG: glycosyltransferase, partial [Chloroflexota bacterium]|nr:glycosyltransferase [Chloroflexota bacterium]
MLHLYQVLVTALIALIFLNVANNLHILSEAVPRGELPQPLPLVSVLVPARNEERNIGPCLSSLLAQDYANLEILVLDDDSSDRTAQMVEGYARKDARLRLLKGAPLLQGWHGKAYACHQLAQAARGEYLLFTDADTVHTPHSVSWTLRLAKERGADLVTYFPRLVTESFWEKTIMPIMHFGILSYLPLGLVERSQNPWFSMALGPFMFFGREFYQGIGGHAAVKDEIAEDVALGRLVKRAGGRLLLTDGTEVLRVRFYHSLGEVWRGFTKSAFAAADYSAPAFLGLLVLNFFLFLLPYYFLYLWL